MHRLVVLVFARLAVLVVLAVAALLFMPAPPLLPIVYGPIVPNSFDVISYKHIIVTCNAHAAIYIRPSVHDVVIINNVIDVQDCPEKK